MTRDEAYEIVKPYIFKYEQYNVVSYNDIGKLLADQLDDFIRDPIRYKGPSGVPYYYYWNIVDYVMKRPLAEFHGLQL